MKASSLTPIWINWKNKSKNFTVLVNTNDTIHDVKEKISEIQNITPEQQCLILQSTEQSHDDSVMDDDRTIGSYLQHLESCSSNGDTIELVRMDEENTTKETEDKNQTEEMELQELLQEFQMRQRQEHMLRHIAQQEGEKQITVNGENWRILWGRRGLMKPGK